MSKQISAGVEVGSAGQTHIQPHTMGWEECPRANEYVDTAIKL